MLSVDGRVDVVESRLRAGELSCPACSGVLAAWGWARPRWLRDGVERVELRPRRGRCRGCRVTHVLLPLVGLLRRVDVVEVIGVALEAKALGVGSRRIGVRVGVAASTVRGWLSRFASRAEQIRVFFTRLALSIDASVSRINAQGSVFADAVEAIGQAAYAAAAVFGARPVWQFASGATGGGLLTTRTRAFPPIV